MDDSHSHWRPCSSCKTSIGFEKTYWVCNVSTCNRKRTGLVFCAVECWDSHLGVVNHRESFALERRSPSAGQRSTTNGARPGTADPRGSRDGSARPPRRILPVARPAARDETPRDILIVATKLKAYVRARSGMNTSEKVLESLSDAVRRLCDEAIRRAGIAERKTLLSRDFD
ncbi:MAG: hypothetical protein ABFS46_10690 [Myxococcota bacterium]